MAKILLNTIIALGQDLDQLSFVKKVSEEQLNIDGIEVRGEMFSEDPATRKAEFTEIRALADAHNWDLFISHPSTLFNAEGLEPEVAALLKEADEFKCLYAKFYVGDVDGVLAADQAETQAIFDTYEVQATIENAQSIENGSIENVLRSLDHIAQQDFPLGFTFDLGNWLVIGEDPQAAFEATKNHIDVFHLKNMDENGDYSTLTDGAANLDDYTQTDRPYLLEFPMTWEDLLGEIKVLRASINR